MVPKCGVLPDFTTILGPLFWDSLPLGLFCLPLPPSPLGLWVMPHHHREQCSYIRSPSSYDLPHVDLHLGPLDSWEVGRRDGLRKTM